MEKSFRINIKELSEKLWFKPLLFCFLSVAAALLGHLADDSFIVDIAPAIEKSSVENLLSTISSSMLVIAIFAVGAMLSAFAAASSTATPRSFKLVVADDVSQNALSVFIGSFIYSIVATLALKNGFYGQAGYFSLFVVTIIVFAIVILTFLRWVERISKLGRLSHTIKKVEDAATQSIKERKANPLMGAAQIKDSLQTGTPIFSDQIGYIQYINMNKLQKLALEIDATFVLNALPGTFVLPDKPLLFLKSGSAPALYEKIAQFNSAYIIGDERSFYDDPRFGLIALSEIASRALSPGINDPGTAIAVIGSHSRLFNLWLQKDNKETKEVKYDRIEAPELALADMFEDAFRPIARDGAGNLEVMIRLQKAFKSFYNTGTPEVKEIVLAHSQEAMERATLALDYAKDLEVLRAISTFKNG